MATPNLFVFELLNEAGEYLYLDEGLLSTSTDPVALPESPNGWDEITKSFTRGVNSFGIFTKTTTPIKFYGYSKELLEQIYYITGGVNYEAYALLRIKKRIDDYPNIWEYAVDFEGELDFSTWNAGGDEDNVYVQLNIVEKGIAELLEANENIDYEIEFDADARDIDHDGIDLNTEYKFQIKDYQKLDNIWANTYAPFVPVSFDGIFPVVETYPVAEIDLASSDFTSNKLFVAQTDITNGRLDLIGGVEYYNDYPFDVQLYFEVIVFRNQDYTTPAIVEKIFEDPTPLGSGDSRSLTINESHPIDFQEGDFVLVTYGIDLSAGSGHIDIIFQSLELYLRGNYRLGSSIVPSYDIFQFVDRMVQKVTEGGATLQSNYLSTISATSDELAYKYWSLIPRRLRVSSGEGVRNVTQNPVIKYTWGDCVQLLKSIFGNLGIGVSGNKVIIEPPIYFFERTQMIDIGEVKNLNITNANEWIYNSITVGFPDKDYKDINGRDIVHSEVNYSLDIKRVKKEMNLIAPAVADPYAIEQLRAYQFKPTTDNSNDNELVLLYCEAPPSIGDFDLQRYSDTQNGGVYSPTTFYNQPLYPVLNLYRNVPYLKSIKNIVANISGGSAVFQSGLRNVEAYLDIDRPFSIAQNDSVGLNNVSTPPAQLKLFEPVIYKFEHIPVINLFQVIQNNPYRYITFTSQGKTYSGFVLNVDIVSSDSDVYKFDLIGAPLNEVIS